jgi:hypothetical protein
MKNKDKNKIFIIIAVCILIGILFWSFVFYNVITTYNAHKTFEGYCKWRGLDVVNKSADYGYCKSEISGKVFKIVLVNNRWYLDGDLPNCWPF